LVTLSKVGFVLKKSSISKLLVVGEFLKAMLAGHIGAITAAKFAP
jgi:hypothetical protein